MCRAAQARPRPRTPELHRVVVGQQRLQHSLERAEQFLHFEPLRSDPNFAGLDLRQVEQVVHHLLQVARRRFDDSGPASSVRLSGRRPACPAAVATGRRSNSAAFGIHARHWKGIWSSAPRLGADSRRAHPAPHRAQPRRGSYPRARGSASSSSSWRARSSCNVFSSSWFCRSISSYGLSGVLSCILRLRANGVRVSRS